MKHKFSFLPSLRRTTLLALLYLGMMPVLAETVYTIKFKEKDGQRVLCMKDMGEGVVQYVKNDNTDASKWRKISCGGDLVYLQNVSTKRYLCCGTERYGSNGEWWYYTTSTTETYEEEDNYKWYFADEGVFSAITLDGDIGKKYHLHSANQYNNVTDEHSSKPNIPCGISINNYNDYSKVDVVESTITSSYTFPANSVWYLDMRTITSGSANFLVDFGDKYSVTQTISGSATKQSGTNGEFQNCNKPFLQITFSDDAVVDEDKHIFKCYQGGWAEVKNNFPAAGQNMMVVSADGKSITWDTYTPPTCTNCEYLGQ